MAIQLSEAWNPAALDSLPADVFAGGWVGYTSYDTVRYVYPGDALPRLYQASVTLVTVASSSHLEVILSSAWTSPLV